MKIDYKKELRQLYNAAAKEVVLVEVPGMRFLMIDGAGNPNTSKEYQTAVEALYTLAYTIKFMVKKGKEALDYGVMPLEGLWWVEDMNQFNVEEKDSWQWTMMIMQPAVVTDDLFNQAREQAEKKKSLPSLSKIKLEIFNEGTSVQIMHLGPYSAEGLIVEKLHRFIQQNGYQTNGRHHEIYLSDPRKSAPEKMKTIIRQPVKL